MKEKDIRPRGLFSRYLELCKKEAIEIFEGCSRVDIPCPGCGQVEAVHQFNKWGFDYATCNECGSLFQTPRPDRNSFDRFYRDSRSADYWANTFFPSVAEARRIHLVRPKIEQIVELCGKDDFVPASLCEVGAGYGLFLDEWKKRFPEAKTIGIEPNPALAEKCRQKGLSIIEEFVEDATGYEENFDLIVAMEVIEHIHDPFQFCLALRRRMNAGGRALVTGPTVDGFDIQVLWEHSRSVSPPHHLNLLSVSGFENLMKRAGFSLLRVFTPGHLDVEIVQKAVEEDPSQLSSHRFVSLLLSRGKDAQEEFQTFLQEHRLSSHCWIWAAL